MKMVAHKNDWVRFPLVLLMIFAIAVLFLLPGGVMMLGVMWFWMFLMFGFWILWFSIGVHPPRLASRHGATIHRQIESEATALQAMSDVVQKVMDVRFSAENEGVQIFRGPLKESPNTVYEQLTRALGDKSAPYLQEDETFGAAILVAPKSSQSEARETTAFPWVNWLLLFLTFITTTLAGAAYAGVDALRDPARITAGLPYALGLMAILGIHELGHFFTAKYHGIQVTPPYFIPVPFALGTFGAFIQMKSPTQNRKALFDVAVAGPIAGLVVAIPALLIGLRSSVVVQGVATDAMSHMGGGTSVGSSILFALLSKLALGADLQSGHFLKLSPLAFAGWLGLLVTALNLLPIGQLDGGHMARAMFGTRTGSTISRVAMWSLFLLALFVWPGLFMWAIIVFFLAGHGAPPLNDLTPITPARRGVGYLMFTILAMIIVPLPHAFWSAAGIHCPYL